MESSYGGLVANVDFIAFDHFYLFTAWASHSKQAQERLQAVQPPQGIVALAVQKGYAITIEQLRLFSRRLQETHWVWNQHDPQWWDGFIGSETAESGQAWRFHNARPSSPEPLSKQRDVAGDTSQRLGRWHDAAIQKGG